ncbi:MAG TPA: riboflavin biosynthesis protein RibF [Lacunisphaera sp.]|nr:riboflavin biosynthesis protein RibF [Lacunisphaera sp.]
MKALLQFNAIAAAKLPERPAHLAIGMFDGVHLGHQSVIESAVHSARRSGGVAGVLTFWPHPSALFRPDQPTRLMMTPAMKHTVLSRLGLDFVIEQEFTRAFAQTDAREFVALLRRSLSHLAAVYVGENWRFGRGREGDVSVLVAEARNHGLEVFSAERINYNGAPISSSRIRDLLAKGEIAEANALLGYTYFASGVVQRGRRLGHQLGFPTLNLPWEPDAAPAYGVYAVEVSGHGRAAVPGVANYGLRPTVEDTHHPLLEVHLLADSRLTYGDAITVNWLKFLRPEARFNSVEELRMQIKQDVDTAREYFRTRG